jgi:hypothetical protein
MADNLIAAKIIRVPPAKVKGRAGNIIDPITAQTSHVIVLPHVAVKASLSAGHL